MKRMFNSNNGSNKRVCFSEDTKPDSSFPDDAIPPHHFHLGQDVYAAVTYFATMVQVHLRHYKRDGNNRLFPTKRGVCLSPVLGGSHLLIKSSKSTHLLLLKKLSL
ncbi:hypothetical protein TNCT_68541 [Trichonephila clavata]|uniref:Uncharacterized protein n=1 Tax=Trichonephila clavata TaxID=2740835 RepID=A0A8X6M2V4_TRICU|nr:hypothetical protein TNCT_68541 [Trichonephila clavata]